MARRRARSVPERLPRPSPRSSTRPGYERSALREATAWLVALKIAALILVVDPAGLGAFDLPKSLASRALAWILAALVLVAVVRYGTAVLPRSRLSLAVGAYVVAVAASAALSPNASMALFGDWGRFLGVTFVLDMAVLYLAAAVALRTETDRLVLFAAVGAATAASVLYALAQYAGIDPVRWSVDPRSRPFGTLGNADVFAHLLAVVSGGALAVAALRASGRVRWIAGGLAALTVLTATVVATRAFVAGLGAAVVALAVVWIAARRPSRRDAARLGGGALAAAAVVAVIVLLTPLGTRLTATLQGTAVNDRILIYDTALRMTADRPVLGWGPDTFGAVSLRYRVPGTEGVFNLQRQNAAHDWILQSAATTGLVGLAALLALVVTTTVALWRRRALATDLTSAVLVASIAYWAEGLLSVGSISVDWVPFLAAGIAAAPTAGTAREHPETPAARAIVWAIGIAALVLVASGMRLFSANESAGRAPRLSSAFDNTSAVAAAEQATRYDAGRSQYWVQLGRAYQASGRERDAGDAYVEAARRDPWDPDLWQHLAASRAKLALAGDPTGGGISQSTARADALAAAAKVIDADPNTSASHFGYATVAFNLDDARAALREAVRAIELYQGDNEYDRVAALAAAKLGDAEARDLLERAVRVKNSVELAKALAELTKKLGG